MSTTATFTVNGTSNAFSGTVITHRAGRVALEVDRDGTAGLDGEDEIQMGRRGRFLTLKIRLQGFADDAALAANVALWERRIGWHGTVALTGGIVRSYTGCTLQQVDAVGNPTSQSDPALLRTQEVEFEFYQLKPV